MFAYLGKRRQLLACWADQFTAALLCVETVSEWSHPYPVPHINHLETADATDDATRTSSYVALDLLPDRLSLNNF